MNENLEEVDQIQKTETKKLDTYIDQVTTDKLSLVSKLREELSSLHGACVHLYDNPRILRCYKVCKIIRVLFRV
jgi:hypothetical protein